MIAANYVLSGNSTISFIVNDLINVNLNGYTRIAWFPYANGQNFIQLSFNFVGEYIYITVTNHHTTTLTFDILVYIAYAKNEFVRVKTS